MNHFRVVQLIYRAQNISPLIPSKQPNLLKQRKTDTPTEEVPLIKAHLIENI